MVILAAISMLFIASSATASPGALIADKPTITVQGTEDFDYGAWGGWWIRGGSTGVAFTFTGINTAAIPGSHVRVCFNLGVTNHVNGEHGLDGLVDITVGFGQPLNYAVANVLFDNADPTNHVYLMTGPGSYETTASILVNKNYIQAGTLVIKVHRHTDVKDNLPAAPVCQDKPIDMSTTPPTVPTGCYDFDDAHTVHIYVATTDASGTRAASGEVTIYTISEVGGVALPVDKLGLLAPYIGLASTITVATVAAAIYVKRKKEKQ